MCFFPPGDICPFSSMHLTTPSGPDVVGYRSHRERTAIRNGAGLRPTHDSVLSWRTSQPGSSLRETTLTEHSGRPGPAVVGYLVKDESPSGVRIPRLSDIVSLGSTTFICPGSPNVHLSHAPSPTYGRRACDGPETVGYLLQRATTPTVAIRPSVHEHEVRAGRTGLSDSAVAGSSPAARTACVAQG